MAADELRDGELGVDSANEVLDATVKDVDFADDLCTVSAKSWGTRRLVLTRS